MKATFKVSENEISERALTFELKDAAIIVDPFSKYEFNNEDAGYFIYVLDKKQQAIYLVRAIENIDLVVAANTALDIVEEFAQATIKSEFDYYRKQAAKRAKGSKKSH